MDLSSLVSIFTAGTIAAIWSPEDPERTSEGYLESYVAYHALRCMAKEMEDYINWASLTMPYPIELDEWQQARFVGLGLATRDLLHATCHLGVFEAGSAAENAILGIPRLCLFPRSQLSQMLEDAMVTYDDYMKRLETTEIQDLIVNDRTLKEYLRGVQISARLLEILNSMLDQVLEILQNNQLESEGDELGPDKEFLIKMRDFAVIIANDLVCNRHAEATIAALRTYVQNCPPSIISNLGTVTLHKSDAQEEEQYKGLVLNLGNFGLMRDLCRLTSTEVDWVRTVAGLAMTTAGWSSKIAKSAEISSVLRRKQILGECFEKIGEMENLGDRQRYFCKYARHAFAMFLAARLIGGNRSSTCQIVNYALAPIMGTRRIPTFAGAGAVPKAMDLVGSICPGPKVKRAQQS